MPKSITPKIEKACLRPNTITPSESVLPTQKLSLLSPFSSSFLWRRSPEGGAGALAGRGAADAAAAGGIGVQPATDLERGSGFA